MADDEDTGVQDELQQATSQAGQAGSRAAALNEIASSRQSQAQSPLGGLLDGIVRGYQIRQQMHDQVAENQRQKTQDVLNDQKASVQDIMNRQMLQQAGRPVTNGMVTETRPDTSTGVPTGGMGSGPISGVPTTQATVPGGTFVRKADPSRTVTYKGLDGSKPQTELYTEQEQQQRATDAAQAKFRANAIPLSTSAEQQKAGLPAQIYIAPEHLAPYMQATGQYQPVQTTQAQQDAGASPVVPQKEIGRVIANTGAGLRNDATNQSRQSVAAGNNDTKTTIANAGNATKTAIAAGSDATKKTIAAGNNQTKASIAAGAQSGANARAGNRLTASQTAQQNKTLQGLQAKEDDLKAARVQIHADAQNAKLTDAQRQTAKGRLATTAYQLQSYQTRKAGLVGAQTPPKVIMDKIGEGQQATGPDGHTWKKNDGIVYFVK